MKSALRRTAENGFWPGGPAPYGYRLAADPDGSSHTVVQIDPKQAELIRRVTRMICFEGYTTYSAAKALNAEGVTTVTGVRWQHENLCTILRKPYLAGRWTYHSASGPIDIDLDPILTRAEWDLLQKCISGTPRPQRPNRTYALSGRGRAHLHWRCGKNLSGQFDHGKAYHNYKCSGSKSSLGPDRCTVEPYRVNGALRVSAGCESGE